MQRIHRRFAAGQSFPDWVDPLTQELVRSQALRRVGETIPDA